MALDDARRRYDAALLLASKGFYDVACENAYACARFAALELLEEGDHLGHRETIRLFTQAAKEPHGELGVSAAEAFARLLKDRETSAYRKRPVGKKEAFASLEAALLARVSWLAA